MTALAVGVSPIGAFDSAGNASALQDVTVNPPSPPDGLSATAIGSGEIDLSWTSHSAPSTIFQIDRNGVVIGQTAAGATTYKDMSVSDGTGYAIK